MATVKLLSILSTGTRGFFLLYARGESERVCIAAHQEKLSTHLQITQDPAQQVSPARPQGACRCRCWTRPSLSHPRRDHQFSSRTFHDPSPPLGHLALHWCYRLPSAGDTVQLETHRKDSWSAIGDLYYAITC